MARERIVKLPPRKRGGKLTVRQVERAVKKVIRERLEWEASESYQRIYSTQSTPLLEAIAEMLDIPETHHESAVKRYKGIRAWLDRDESSVACYNPEIYPQGSFALGTVMKPLSDAEAYDIDLVCELKLQKTEISQKQLNKLVGQEIKSYVRTNNINSQPKESRYHWTLNYVDGAQFHVNILPAIPDAESFKKFIASRGSAPSDWSDSTIATTDNTLSNYCRIDTDWPRSNPKGYAEWFRSRIDNVPEYKVKTPLQRSIQILKRHRDLWFDENQSAYEEKAKPISIIITTLAARAYNNQSNLQQALMRIVTGMQGYIAAYKTGVVVLPNPVNSLENLADEWQEHPIRRVCFEDWLKQIYSDLTQALALSDIQSVAESLKLCLGERVISEALRNALASTGVSENPMPGNLSHEINR